MNRPLSLLALGLALALGTAHAADDKKPNTQQSKMAACNKEAADKKGDERKDFMKTCLSAKPAAAMTQQTRMTVCNKDAKDMKGDARRAFMKECLSKKT